MIARHWRGVARRERAEAYVEHLRAETFPALARLPGFLSASILRRRVSEGEEFLVITNWESLAAIRAFAGEDVESAVVPDTVQEMMVTFERTARHYEVVT
jgi:heme-degrading monooxygenase HmoA